MGPCKGVLFSRQLLTGSDEFPIPSTGNYIVTVM